MKIIWEIEIMLSSVICMFASVFLALAFIGYLEDNRDETFLNNLKGFFRYWLGKIGRMIGK